jgi:predicted enzyme related to lactoylglutathione lyase
MANGDIGWLELPGGNDCRRTGRFYARVFGWQVDDDGKTVWFREASGTLGGAFRGDLPAAETGPILYLLVTDATAALDRITDEEGATIMPRSRIAPGAGHRALFRDPAGTTMGLYEPEG